VVVVVVVVVGETVGADEDVATQEMTCSRR